jgi:hypothetical protein
MRKFLLHLDHHLYYYYSYLVGLKHLCKLFFKSSIQQEDRSIQALSSLLDVMA